MYDTRERVNRLGVIGDNSFRLRGRTMRMVPLFQYLLEWQNSWVQLIKEETPVYQLKELSKKSPTCASLCEKGRSDRFAFSDLESRF